MLENIKFGFWAGEGEGEAQGEGDKGGEKGGGGGGEQKTFTQDQVNALMAENKRNLQEQNKKLIADLELLKKSESLTKKQASDLETQIKELKSRTMTEAELAQEKHEARLKELSENLEKETSSSKQWESRFTTLLRNNEIIKEAVAAQAFDPETIISIISGNTSVVEITDAEGKPTGQYRPEVTVVEEKDGKRVELKLSVKDAIKRMADNTERWGFLFKSTDKGGTGNRQSSGTSGGTGSVLENAELARTNPEEFRRRLKEERKKNAS